MWFYRGVRPKTTQNHSGGRGGQKIPKTEPRGLWMPPYARFNHFHNIKVHQFRIQTHCDLSFQNLCKGDALEEYAEKVKNYYIKAQDFLLFQKKIVH